ncbi:MAG: ATP-binding protein [Kangiellaceae bacterium]|jgi:signal transduction histidine kinase|nr:ATP-binding protein [Kangiellaceae bacterium]
MSSQIKIILLTIIVCLLATGLVISNQNALTSELQMIGEQQNNRQINQVRNQINLFFNDYITTNNQLATNSDLFNTISIESVSLLVKQLNSLTSITNEVVLYSAGENKLYRANSNTIQGQYLGLEQQIMRQDITRKNQQLILTTFDGEYALVDQRATWTNDQLEYILFNIIKFDDGLLNYFKQLTGADFQLTIAKKQFSTTDSFNKLLAQSITLPVTTNIPISLSFVPNNLYYDNNFVQLHLLVTVIVCLLLAGLIVIVTLLAFRERKQLQALSKAATDSTNGGQFIQAAGRINLDNSLEPFINDVKGLMSQQISQIKQLAIKLKNIQAEQEQHKRHSEKLENELSSVAAAPKTTSEFLSKMGDEITTPMKSLTSMIKLLNECQLDDEPRELLNIANRSSSTLINNLNNILDFSKLDAGLLKLSEQNVEISKLIDDIIAEFKPHAEAKSIKLSASISPEVPASITSDATRIKQILKNLVGNAIRFTKQGDVAIFADLILEKDQKSLRLTVKDSGLGMPEEAQKGLFDSLDTKTKLTNSSFAGRLRLIVSKQLVDLLGGKIGVKSEINKGSRFWFTMKI